MLRSGIGEREPRLFCVGVAVFVVVVVVVVLRGCVVGVCGARRAKRVETAPHRNTTRATREAVPRDRFARTSPNFIPSGTGETRATFARYLNQSPGESDGGLSALAASASASALALLSSPPPPGSGSASKPTASYAGNARSWSSPGRAPSTNVESAGSVGLSSRNLTMMISS